MKNSATSSRATQSRQIAANIRAHDRLAKKYERNHGEIYNSVEQSRLRNALAEAISLVDTESASKRVLDFGCGAGNLTQHIADLGCEVLASDVSAGCLSLVASRQYPTAVDTVLLNGVDLEGISDESVDAVATYSVLHHVPDYLGVLKEFMRVLKPGGIIYIDHELTEEYWRPGPTRLEFLEAITPSAGWGWQKYLKFDNYKNWFMCKFVDPRYRPEGDIHVFADDHIEWDKVSEALRRAGAHIVEENKYLLFRAGYDLSVYERYAKQTSDMQCLVARKPRLEPTLDW